MIRIVYGPPQEVDREIRGSEVIPDQNLKNHRFGSHGLIAPISTSFFVDYS